MKPILFPLTAIAATLAINAAASTQTANKPIEQMLVSADVRDTPLQDLAVSASIIDENTITARNAKHLEGIINLAPNVNFSAGAARGRFFQIRGIGERSQFVEPVNPSVGLIIDGIDLTGLGGAATTLDIQQVEILRGPQGTLYGANALAGLINMVSGSPSDYWTGKASVDAGNYNSRTLSGVVSGPISSTLGFRLALEQYKSDGYQKNAYLHIDDNANYDEQTARGKLRWQPSDALKVDVTALYINNDDGYDGFSLDNTRTTLSDQPGHDRQEIGAGSIKANWQANHNFHLVALLSHANAHSEYGYDEDWAYSTICQDYSCMESSFTSFDNYIRHRKNTTADVRLVSDNNPDTLGWVAGIYHRDQTVALHREWTYLSDDFLSHFSSQNSAVYGQLSLPLANRLKLVSGLRFEHRSGDYNDSDNVNYHPSENMWGGKLSLEYHTLGGSLLYALASRGYKAGGFNSDTSLPPSDRQFSSESLWNYEAGVKTHSQDQRWQAKVAVFYQDRKNVQAKQSLLQKIGTHFTFTDYLTNAAAGNSYGLEANVNWQANDTLALFTSIGLLNSEFVDFKSYAHAKADRANHIPYDLSGHDLPQAPHYQYTLGSVVNITDRWYARASIEGKDSFYFSSRHEAKSKAYTLLNARLGYNTEQWEFALWGRNLTNIDTEVRGFGSFGNDPRDGYATKPYYQYGAPRTFGVNANYTF